MNTRRLGKTELQVSEIGFAPNGWSVSLRKKALS